MAMVALFAAGLLPGCLGAGMTLTRVPALPPGETEFAMGAGVSTVGQASSDGAFEVTGVAPALEFSIRQGIADGLDLGGRIYTLPLAGRIDLKWQWHESLHWNASVVPGVTLGLPAILTPGPLPPFLPVARGRGVDPIVLHLPALFGLWLEQHQIVLALKFDVVFSFAGDTPAVFPLAGGSIGFDVNLLPHGHLVPELTGSCAPTVGACSATLGVGYHAAFF